MKTTLRKFKTALHSLPDSLNDTYDEVWMRIKSQNVDDAQVAKRVIYWIFYAVRPLTIAELQHALAVEPEDTYFDEDNITDENLLISVCCGIVTVQQESSTVGLVHYTTQEYLEYRWMELFPEARREILRSCITYLSFKEFGTGACATNEEMEARLQARPFIQYAAKLWGYHAKLGQTEETEQDSILDFLQLEGNIACSIQIILPKANNITHCPQKTSSLWIASYFGLSRIVQLLLHDGANTEAKDDHGMTALDLAASRGHDNVVQVLLENKSGRDTGLALFQAAWGGHTKVIQLLLQHGVDIDGVDQIGMTALHLAAQMGHEDSIRLLLQEKADINKKTYYGKDALALATRGGHISIVSMLLEAQTGSQRPVQDYLDLLISSGRRQQYDVMQVILNKAAGLNIEDDQGRTTLHIACSKGNRFLIEGLISCGLSITVADKQLRTCLHYAATAEAPDVLECLMQKGLDPTQVDGDHWTPLHWAARAGRKANVQILLDVYENQGFEPQDTSEWDPRSLAFYHAHFSLAESLADSNKTANVSLGNHWDECLSYWLKQEINDPKQIISRLRHVRYTCDGCDLVSLFSNPDLGFISRNVRIYLAQCTNATIAQISTSASSVF